MGGFFSKKEKEVEKPADEAVAEDQKPRLLCKWDSVEVKRAFDDLATQIILEKGYKEDMYVSNVKIVLGAITCALALTAQFHPSKFPANYYLTLCCVVGYFVFNTLLQLFAIFKARDVILFTHPLEARLESSIAAWVHEDGTIEEPIFREDVERLLAEVMAGNGASKKDK